MPKSLMRSLGEFFGHIARGVKTPVAGSDRREVGRSVEEEQVETPRGQVTLRRTTIDEVIVDPKASTANPDRPRAHE